ncbi:MAG: hypothetical protein HQ582_27125 [Planctomycetes bacterium]|nr:hypothetical protein [Planctomycetota bacterium]
MLTPISPLGSFALYSLNRKPAPAGTADGAFGRQLHEVLRRQRLRAQQQELQTGAADYHKRPPYPWKPRPPS